MPQTTTRIDLDGTDHACPACHSVAVGRVTGRTSYCRACGHHFPTAASVRAEERCGAHRRETVEAHGGDLRPGRVAIPPTATPHPDVPR